MTTLAPATPSSRAPFYPPRPPRFEHDHIVGVIVPGAATKAVEQIADAEILGFEMLRLVAVNALTGEDSESPNDDDQDVAQFTVDKVTILAPAIFVAGARSSFFIGGAVTPTESTGMDGSRCRARLGFVRGKRIFSTATMPLTTPGMLPK